MVVGGGAVGVGGVHRLDQVAVAIVVGGHGGGQPAPHVVVSGVASGQQRQRRWRRRATGALEQQIPLVVNGGGGIAFGLDHQHQVLVGIVAVAGDQVQRVADFLGHLDLVVENVVLIHIVHEGGTAADVVAADVAGVAPILDLAAADVVVGVVENVLQVLEVGERERLRWVGREDVVGSSANDLHHLVQLVDHVVGGDAPAIHPTGDVAHGVVLVEVADGRRRRVAAGVAASGVDGITGHLLQVAASVVVARWVVNDAIPVRVSLRVIHVDIHVALGVRRAQYLAERVVGVQLHDLLCRVALDQGLVGSRQQVDSGILNTDEVAVDLVCNLITVDVPQGGGA